MSKGCWAAARVLSPGSWPWEEACSPQPTTQGSLCCRSGGFVFQGTEAQNLGMNLTTASEMTLQGAKCSWLLYRVDITATLTPPLLQYCQQARICMRLLSQGPYRAWHSWKTSVRFPRSEKQECWVPAQAPFGASHLTFLQIWVARLWIVESRLTELQGPFRIEYAMFLCSTSWRKKIKVCKARVE